MGSPTGSDSERNQEGVDSDPVARRVHRVARRERQFGDGRVGGRDDEVVVGPDDLGRRHLVHEAVAGEHRDDDLVAGRELVDVAERLAERRAVAGDRGIAELAGQRCVGIVTRALLEVLVRHAGHDVQGVAAVLADLGDLELGDHLASLDRRDVLVDRCRRDGRERRPGR